MKNRTLPALISVRELAPILGVHAATVRRWCRDGSFPKPFGSGNLRWVRRDLIAAGLLTDTLGINTTPSQN